MADHLAKVTSVDFSHMTRDDLILFRRHLLGVVAMIEKILAMTLTTEPKVYKG